MNVIDEIILYIVPCIAGTGRHLFKSALPEKEWLLVGNECYRYYSAIKLRKNPSRTYFLDRMQTKLNEKIRRDEDWKG